MIKKVPIGKLLLLVDKSIPMLQLSKQLNAYGKDAKLLFVEPQAGAGFLQWTLHEEGWKPFSDYDDATKPIIAEVFQKRLTTLKESLKGFELSDAVLTVPSESEFVFFRPNGEDWEIAVTAWGYRYSDPPVGTEIGTWVVEKEYQEVNLGFLWNGALLPDMPFYMEGMPRVTPHDGNFYIEPLEVGMKLSLRVADGQQFTLVVEKEKSEYRYDLTKYQKVAVSVMKDGQALANQACDITFNGAEYHLQTDETGAASMDIPLACTQDGKVAESQPDCIATCMSETQQKTLLESDEAVRFDFVFNTAAPEPEPVPEPVPGPMPEPKLVCIQLTDYDGYPMPELPFKLTTKKMGDQFMKTDEKGFCLIPQEWFTQNEKMQIDIHISPEYQETHDLHQKKKKK